MAIYIIVLCNTDCLYWFSNAFAYLRLNRMSRSTQSIMVYWNKANESYNDTLQGILIMVCNAHMIWGLRLTISAYF